MTKKSEPEAVSMKPVPLAYTKEQILHCKRYQPRRDALGFLLEDGKTYTDTEINTILNDYMKGEVK